MQPQCKDSPQDSVLTSLRALAATVRVLVQDTVTGYAGRGCIGCSAVSWMKAAAGSIRLPPPPCSPRRARRTRTAPGSASRRGGGGGGGGSSWDHLMSAGPSRPGPAWGGRVTLCPTTAAAAAASAKGRWQSLANMAAGPVNVLARPGSHVDENLPLSPTQLFIFTSNLCGGGAAEPLRGRQPARSPVWRAGLPHCIPALPRPVLGWAGLGVRTLLTSTSQTCSRCKRCHHSWRFFIQKRNLYRCFIFSAKKDGFWKI